MSEHTGRRQGQRHMALVLKHRASRYLPNTLATMFVGSRKW